MATLKQLRTQFQSCSCNKSNETQLKHSFVPFLVSIADKKIKVYRGGIGRFGFVSRKQKVASLGPLGIQPYDALHYQFPILHWLQNRLFLAAFCHVETNTEALKPNG